MNTATDFSLLADQYVHFHNLDKDKLDLTDYLMLYEALTNRLDEAGISFYNLGVYVRDRLN